MLGSLFSIKKNKPATPDLLLNQVYLELNQLQRDRQFLDVKIPGEDNSLQSLILEIDPDEKTILIDEFFPRGFLGLPGQKLKFCLRRKGGRSIRFESAILERHSIDGTPVYVIDLPESLNNDQRRGSYRIPVETHKNINLQFFAPDRCQYSGRLSDISIGGICLQSRDSFVRDIRENDTLLDLAFEFAGTQLECDLVVKSVQTKVEPGMPFRIGAAFADLPVQESRQLERCIMQMQRASLRKEQQQEQIIN